MFTQGTEGSGGNSWGCGRGAGGAEGQRGRAEAGWERAAAGLCGPGATPSGAVTARCVAVTRSLG